MAISGSVEKKLAQKISRREAKIAVVGLGYVGLPLAIEFCSAGFQVYGLDVNRAKIASLRRGRSNVEDVDSKTLSQVIQAKKLRVTENSAVLSKCDCVIICVPTPLNKVKEPDISYVLDAAIAVRQSIHRGQLIILESTIYPGTTEEIVQPEITNKGLRIGRDFFLSFSPERIDPGNRNHPLRKIPKVVGGVTKACTRLTTALYRTIVQQVVPVSSPRVAEMTKLLENTFRIVNIGLMNELVPVAHRLNLNLWEAIDAAKTKPFGFMPFYPGPGIGGHCIGIDPLYLSWKAKLVGSELRFVELASRINAWMPAHVVRRMVDTLNANRKAIKGSKILLLGASYKKNVGDTRESPTLEIIQELDRLGATVCYHDPHVRKLRIDSGVYRSSPLTAQSLSRYDLVALLTDHDSVNYHLVAQKSKRILDTRNALQRFKKYKSKIVLL